ncbi:hypothetical protein [Mycobacterium sp. IS-1264]|uniref:hypothetical protein n=1 Tax=Mycobacterium sp. IS-1264 TaxID=1834158 RepID=UPI00096F78F3|nr:hypothetical protein [Mycobacterium sp. IS-1264]OMC46152.1 hypothetical protein A5744_08715 [Mycobacterium sp. IS-1264]
MPQLFWLQFPDGTVEQHEVTPGGKLRLAVGERDAPRGTVWNVWATPNSGDFYIAERNTAGVQKWSFHKTGMWLHQFVDNERAEQQARAAGYTGRSRVVDKWDQPPEIGDSGWTLAFSIRIRHQDLEEHDDSKLPQDIYWVPPPPEGSARYLHVYILRPTGRMIELDPRDMVPLCSFGLADNRQVLILGSTAPVTEETDAQIERWLDTALAGTADGRLQEADHPRLLVHTTRNDGHRMVWDLAIPTERLRARPRRG